MRISHLSPVVFVFRHNMNCDTKFFKIPLNDALYVSERKIKTTLLEALDETIFGEHCIYKVKYAFIMSNINY